MSAIKTQLTNAMKAAMKAQDKDRLGVIRMALSAFKQIEVDERVELDDARVLAVMEKLIKQRRESVAAFASRPELAAKETAEIAVLQEFLPAQLSEAELDAIITEVIATTGATQARDMGKVMNELRPRVAGRADIGSLSQKIKARLS